MGTSEAKVDHTESSAAVDVELLFSSFELRDPSFKLRLPESSVPLFRAAVAGEKFSHVRFGVIGADRTRHLLDDEGWPLFSNKSTKDFVSISHGLATAEKLRFELSVHLIIALFSLMLADQRRLGAQEGD